MTNTQIVYYSPEAKKCIFYFNDKSYELSHYFIAHSSAEVVNQKIIEEFDISGEITFVLVDHMIKYPGYEEFYDNHID